MDITELPEDELKKIFELDDAIEKDEPEKLRAMLKASPEYLHRNVFRYGKYSLLGSAAVEGNVGICNLLIELGADVNSVPEFAQSALELAASRGHLDVVKLLLNAGAKVDGPDKSIIAPLMSATISGHTKTAKYLLDAGANPNRFHLRLNETALDSALVWKQPEIEEILRSIDAVSILEGTDWSPHPHGDFLNWVDRNFGRILPVSIDLPQNVQAGEMRLALANKKKNKLLFTTGLSAILGEPFELGVILPGGWNPYDSSLDNFFPVRLLASLSARVRLKKEPIEGMFASGTDDDMKDLAWPVTLSAIWVGKRLADDDPLMSYGERVRQMEFFAVVPVKKSGKKYSSYDPGAFQGLSYTKMTLPITS